LAAAGDVCIGVAASVPAGFAFPVRAQGGGSR
jgi:hypothetical protein